VPRNLNKAFGRRIVELRKGMTQRQLSLKTGISTQHISNMENGHKEACLGNIARLARAFGVTISEMTKGL
jgi:transcriptional regulator with XRE-family HTH domain